MKLSKASRETVRTKYGGHCAYCGCVLGPKWHADHIVAIIRKIEYVSGKGFRNAGGSHRPENERADNINPACVQCNINKSTYPLEFWREEIQRHVDRLNKRSAGYRVAKAFGLIQETGIPIQFYFERPPLPADAHVGEARKAD